MAKDGIIQSLDWDQKIHFQGGFCTCMAVGVRKLFPLYVEIFIGLLESLRHIKDGFPQNEESKTTVATTIPFMTETWQSRTVIYVLFNRSYSPAPTE